MDKIVLTRSDFEERNGRLEYSGTLDLATTIEASVEIDKDLGVVWFQRLFVRGSIRALAGSSISAGEGISAGWGISTRLGSISAKLRVKAGARIAAGIDRLGDEVDTVSAQAIEGAVVCGKQEIVSEPSKKPTTA